MSPSFWAGLDSTVYDAMLAFSPITEGSLLKEVIEKFKSHEIRPYVYLDWGMDREGFENEYTEALVTKRALEMIDFLRKELSYTSIELQTYEDPIGKHNTSSWAMRISLPLKFYINNIPHSTPSI